MRRSPSCPRSSVAASCSSRTQRSSSARTWALRSVCSTWRAAFSPCGASSRRRTTRTSRKRANRCSLYAAPARTRRSATTASAAPASSSSTSSSSSRGSACPSPTSVSARHAPYLRAVIFGGIADTLLHEIPGHDGFFATKQFAIIALAVILLYFALQKKIQELKVSARVCTRVSLRLRVSCSSSASSPSAASWCTRRSARVT